MLISVTLIDIPLIMYAYLNSSNFVLSKFNINLIFMNHSCKFTIIKFKLLHIVLLGSLMYCILLDSLMYRQKKV